MTRRAPELAALGIGAALAVLSLETADIAMLSLIPVGIVLRRRNPIVRCCSAAIAPVVCLLRVHWRMLACCRAASLTVPPSRRFAVYD